MEIITLIYITAHLALIEDSGTLASAFSLALLWQCTSCGVCRTSLCILKGVNERANHIFM